MKFDFFKVVCNFLYREKKASDCKMEMDFSISLITFNLHAMARHIILGHSVYILNYIVYIYIYI